MNINRDNYEEFFMLYADKELTAEECKAVELFVAENSDLAEELNLLQQLQLKPDTDLVFMNKESLFRNEKDHETINNNNYEEFFVLYADNELKNEEQISVEKFVYNNPSVQSDFELIQKTKLEPDNSIVYTGKEELCRYEKDEKVIPFYISIRVWKWAAAAILILLAGFIWMNKSNNGELPVNTAGKNEIKQEKDSIAPGDTHELVIEEQLAATETQQETTGDKAILKNKNVTSAPQLAKTNLPDLKVKKEKLAEQKVNVAIEEQKDLVAIEHMSPAKVTAVNTIESNISTAKNVTKSVEHKEPIIDQPIYIDTDKKDKEIRYASLSDDKNEDDLLYVSNTAVRKQHPLRGIFRKASRFVERTTNPKSTEGSGILIGNLSIALR